MKTVLLILDGLADGPADRGAAGAAAPTPLECARTPHLDRLAARGTVGRWQPTPPGFAPGSETGLLSTLGATPVAFGRARVEAVGRGLAVPERFTALRATTVRLSGDAAARGTVLQEVAHGEPAVRAVQDASPKLRKKGIFLYPDSAGRHIMLIRGGGQAATRPPHELVGLPVSLGLSETMPVPLEGGLHLWPWGNGPALAPQEVAPGAMITGTDLMRGIAQHFGMEAARVDGATGETDTDLGAKCRAAEAALLRHETVAVHVEGTDMAAHRRGPDEKRRMIERIDSELVGPLAARPGVRLAVTCDHATSSASGRHLPTPVPYLLSDPGVPGRFSEAGTISRPVLDRRAWKNLLAGDAVPC